MQTCDVDVVLVGAGGHARAIVEALGAQSIVVTAFVDRAPSVWLTQVRRYETDEASKHDTAGAFVLGIGGVDPDGLARRLTLFRRYAARGWKAPPVVHSAATVSASAVISAGSQILAAAVVQPDAVIEVAAIVNTGAIVEHGSRVGEGAHVAPGAIVLGGVRIGACAMVGAGALILPGAFVPEGRLVPANTRYPV